MKAKSLEAFFFPHEKQSNNKSKSILQEFSIHLGQAALKFLWCSYNNCIWYGIWWSIDQNQSYFFKENILRLLPTPLAVSYRLPAGRIHWSLGKYWLERMWCVVSLYSWLKVFYLKETTNRYLMVLSVPSPSPNDNTTLFEGTRAHYSELSRKSVSVCLSIILVKS